MSQNKLQLQQQQKQRTPFRSPGLANNSLANLLYQGNSGKDCAVVPQTQSQTPMTPYMDTQWRQRYFSDTLFVRPDTPSSRPDARTPAVVATFDQEYITRPKPIAKLACPVDPANLDNVHDIFFNGQIDPRKKMERILQLWELDFKSTKKAIDIDKIFPAEMCRPIDQEHAEDLLYRLGDVGFGNFSTILNQSFFVVYEDREDIRGVTRYGVIDGNIRLAAATKYNETASFNKQIRTITVDYILKQKPSISQAIGISTLASNAAQHDRLEYDQEQILRNARLILKNDCKILKIVPNSDPSISAQQWQRDHEKIVREELAKILNVDPAKVLSSIWRTVQITDDDFDALLKSLAEYGTSIVKLATICTTYRRRPRETRHLCSLEHEDPDDFFAELDDITGCDWQRTLKDKKAYDDNFTDDEHAHLILGESYDSYNDGGRTTVLEKFLAWRGIAEASRQKTYPDPTSKLNFLAEKFPVFLNDAPTPRPSKNSRAAEPGDEIPPKKGKRSASSKKKPKTTIEFNTGVEMHTLREDYFNHLQDQPHVVGLLSFFLKSNSKNLGDFPDNNIVRRMANQYTSNSGTFDWDKYNTAVTAAAVQQRDT